MASENASSENVLSDWEDYSSASPASNSAGNEPSENVVSDWEDYFSTPAASGTVEPTNTVFDENSRRMQYTAVLGFDPSQSWSSSYSVSAHEEEIEASAGIEQQTKGKKRNKKGKHASFQRHTVPIDRKGNYVFNRNKIIVPISEFFKQGTQAKKERFNQWKLKRIHDSRDLECNICMDKVLQKEDVFNRKFGLLPNCIHTICLECIIKWKGEGSSCCPVCREPFIEIIPCHFYVKCKKQKQRILSIMKAREQKDNGWRTEVQTEVDEPIEFCDENWLEIDDEGIEDDYY